MLKNMMLGGLEMLRSLVLWGVLILMESAQTYVLESFSGPFLSCPLNHVRKLLCNLQTLKI